MSDMFPPDLTEQSVVFQAERLRDAMRHLRECVARGDQDMVRNYIVAVNVALREMRSLLTYIQKEVKRISTPDG